MQAADAPAWLGAVLLIGGIVVAAGVSPLGGLAMIVLGGALLLFLRRER